MKTIKLRTLRDNYDILMAASVVEAWRTDRETYDKGIGQRQGILYSKYDYLGHERTFYVYDTLTMTVCYRNS